MTYWDVLTIHLARLHSFRPEGVVIYSNNNSSLAAHNSGVWSSLSLLKISRWFRIFNTITTLDVWTRKVRFWNRLRNMVAKTMVVRTNG